MQQSIRIQLRVARALDGIAYGLLAASIIVVHPGLGRTPLGDLSNVYLLPLFGVLAATFALPVPPDVSGKLPRMILRLRLACGATLGLAPFVSWWLRACEKPYFLVIAAVCMWSGIWYLLELTGLLHELLKRCSSMGLVFEAMVTRASVLYLDLVVVIAVHVSFIFALFLFPGTVPSDLPRTWLTVPAVLRCAMLLPIFLTIRLLFRSHHVLTASIIWREEREQEPQKDKSPAEGNKEDLYE